MSRINAMTTLELNAFITDELVQKEGYPNVEVYWLEVELIQIAEKWRQHHKASLVKEYHKIFFRLLEMGWTVDLLGIKGLLPSKYMPLGYENLS